MLDRDYFFKEIKVKLLHTMTQSQVDGLNALFNTWDKYFSSQPLEFLAYCLATAYHETTFTLQPIKEYGLGHGHSYGSAVGPYHKSYYGRGDVQLTWIANYEKAEKILNKTYNLSLNLVKEPDSALNPEIAALILFQGEIEGWFTGKKLSDYFGHGKENAVGARHIINGTDKATTIARYYTSFNHSVKNK